jgi:uncharacterized membrane protein YeaQ/YmgE (transglycosylase-associated protein family)
MITYLIALLFTGLIVGALARLALPGRDPMSIPATIGIGIAGSFISGLIYSPSPTAARAAAASCSPSS